MKNLILLVVSIAILMFIEGLVLFQIGYETGLESKTPAKIMEYCVNHKPLQVNEYKFWIYCVESYDAVSIGKG